MRFGLKCYTVVRPLELDGSRLKEFPMLCSYRVVTVTYLFIERSFLRFLRETIKGKSIRTGAVSFRVQTHTGVPILFGASQFYSDQSEN